MEINSQLVIIILLSIFAGIGVGVTFGRNKIGGDRKRLSELEEELKREKEYRDVYEQKVVEHFSQTAQLVNRLTDSYRDVHSHLSESAEQLCQGGSVDLILQLENKNEELVSNETFKQPLDYAPKTSPKERGVLNESFGLESDARHNDQKE